MNTHTALPDWAYAYGGAYSQGIIRRAPDDFIVNEIPSFEPSGKGEHAFVFIEKCSENTEYVARALARFAGVRQRDVSYAGLKDRHARTTQWFSVWLPGKPDPDWTALNSDTIKVLQATRHSKKLRRGDLVGNRFNITLRSVKANQDALKQKNTSTEELKLAIEENLQAIKKNGVPNYFGVQRFGNNGDNLNQAFNMFESGKRPRNKQKGSMYISAARSFLFNEMLAKRIQLNCWDRPMDGEVFGFPGSQRGFSQEGTSEELQRWRINRIHPTCALWGKNESLAVKNLLDIEQAVADANPVFCEGLINKGLKQERRAARMLVPDLFWMWQGDDLILRFSLASGYFATSILTELGDIQEAPREYYAEREASE